MSALCGAQIRDRTQHQPPPPGDNNQTQLNAKKAKRGPRAIAVVEFLPGGGARLVPVALWIDDRFYDASLYGANPEPMALEPETVYEATNYGESTGLFTVTTPEQVKGNWVAAGQWKPHRALDDRLAKQAASKPKQAKARQSHRRPAGTEARGIERFQLRIFGRWKLIVGNISVIGRREFNDDKYITEFP